MIVLTVFCVDRASLVSMCSRSGSVSTFVFTACTRLGLLCTAVCKGCRAVRVLVLVPEMRILSQMQSNQKSKLGPHGYLFLTLHPHHYLRFTVDPLNLPGPTPPLPNLQGILDSGQREQVRIKWIAHKTENNNIANIKKALTTLFLDAFSDAYKRI